MEFCQRHLKDLFQKTADVHSHNTRFATNQNYFVQVSTKTISHRGATFWANIEQHFKDGSHNVFSKQCGAFLLSQHA